MEAGAENYEANGANYTVTTEPHDLGSVRDALETHSLKVTSAELTLVPQNVVPVTDDVEAKKVLRLMDALDDHDDVQNVYANFDITDDLLAAYEG
jgi:transcriptional/translational regulatory protein YebC/TACO1